MPRVPPPTGIKLHGVGIDIISLERAGRFLKKNRRSVSRLLSLPERKRAKKPLSRKGFARMWAAKEAFFKAVGGSWMGIDGFSSLEVSCFPSDRFRVKSTDSTTSNFPEGEGCFFGDEDWVGAYALAFAR